MRDIPYSARPSIGEPRRFKCPQCGGRTLVKFDPSSTFWECPPCHIGVRRSTKYGNRVVDITTGREVGV